MYIAIRCTHGGHSGMWWTSGPARPSPNLYRRPRADEPSLPPPYPHNPACLLQARFTRRPQPFHIPRSTPRMRNIAQTAHRHPRGHDDHPSQWHAAVPPRETRQTGGTPAHRPHTSASTPKTSVRQGGRHPEPGRTHRGSTACRHLPRPRVSRHPGSGALERSEAGSIGCATPCAGDGHRVAEQLSWPHHQMIPLRHQDTKDQAVWPVNQN